MFRSALMVCVLVVVALATSASMALPQIHHEPGLCHHRPAMLHTALIVASSRDIDTHRRRTTSPYAVVFRRAHEARAWVVSAGGPHENQGRSAYLPPTVFAKSQHHTSRQLLAGVLRSSGMHAPALPHPLGCVDGRTDPQTKT